MGHGYAYPDLAERRRIATSLEAQVSVAAELGRTTIQREITRRAHMKANHVCFRRRCSVALSMPATAIATSQALSTSRLLPIGTYWPAAAIMLANLFLTSAADVFGFGEYCARRSTNSSSCRA